MRYSLTFFCLAIFSFSSQVVAQFNCSDAEIINCYNTNGGHFNYYSSTVDGQNTVENYDCEPLYSYSGPDKKFFVPYWPGVDIASLTIVLRGMDEDLDLFVAYGCTTSCYDRSTNGGIENDTVTIPVYNGGANISIFVDGYAGASSNFILEIFANCTEIYNDWEVTCGNENASYWQCSYGQVSGSLETFQFWPLPRQKSAYRCGEETYYNYPFLEQVYEFTTTEYGDIDIILSQYSDHEIFLYNCQISGYYDVQTGINYIIEVPVCLTGGDHEIHYENAPPDTYYVIIDARNNGGYYEMDIYNAHCPYTECYCSPVFGQQLRCESFEPYAVNGGIVAQSGYWNYWRNGSSGDAYVRNNNPRSGQKSLEIDDDNNSDVVFELGNPDDGRFRLEWWMSIEDFAQTELYHYHDPTGNTTNNLAALLNFYGNGQGSLTTGDQSEVAFFTHPQNTYFRCVIIIDTYENTAELWVNNQFVYSWIFSVSAINVPSLEIDVLDFFHRNGNYYVDDICFTRVECYNILCAPNYEPVCVNGVEFQNQCYASCSGYTEYEWEAGACNNYCTDCGQCYYYQHDQADNQKVYFFNEYCEGSNVDYLWTISDTEGNEVSVNYLNNTHANSANPICYFPLPGTYYVCQYVTPNVASVVGSNADVEVFECCYEITISATPCTSPPVPHLTYSYNNGGFNFEVPDQGETDVTYEWELPSSAFNVSQNGNEAYCELPIGCFSVCVYVINPCGMTSYCITVCSNSEACNQLPPILSAIEPLINQQYVSFPGVPFDADEYTWEIPEGESEFLFGDEHSPDAEIEFYNTGTYKVCLKLRYGCNTICICFTIKIGCCYNPCWQYYPHSGWWDYTAEESEVFFHVNAMDNQNLDVEWDYGDGSNGYGGYSNHLYSQAGSYYVCCTVTNYFGCSYTIYKWIYVPGTPCLPGQFPVAGFTFSTNGSQLNLTNTSQDGTQYNWDFGDGSEVSSETNPIHHYQSPGTYVVCLTVVNQCGMSSCCYTITIGEICSYAFYDVEINLNMQETGIEFLGVPSNYEEVQIDYGNGQVEFFNNEEIPSYEYDIDGTYLVCVYVNMGCYSFTFCKTIRIQFCNSTPPVCQFTFEEDLQQPGKILFSNQTTNATGYSWNFGDGSANSTLQNPIHLYNPGTYVVCLTALNGCASDIYCVNITIQQQSNNPPWTNPDPSSKSHTIIVPSNIISDFSGLTLSAGDQISVWYTESGSEKIGGLATYQNGGTAISAVGNDEPAPNKNGFEENELFTFKVWKKNLNQIFEANAVFQPVDGVLITHTDKFGTNGISQLAELKAGGANQLTIALKQGWNLISSNIIPDQPDMPDVFAAIKDQTIIVKNSAGQVYIPSNNLNLIGDWDVRYGYQVKMTEDVDLIINGLQANPASMPIPLNQTWQIISYLCPTSSKMVDELSSILDRTILVKNGPEIFIPGTPIGQNICMASGKGYWLKTSAPGNTTLTYSCINSCNSPISFSTDSDELLNANTGSNATLIIAEEVLKNRQEDLILEVYTASGILVGKGKTHGALTAIPIWGDDATTDEIEGAKDGDILNFVLKDASTEMDMELEFQSISYSSHGIYDLSEMAMQPIDFMLSPNPATQTFQVKFFEPVKMKGTVSIFNLTGQLIHSELILRDQDRLHFDAQRLGMRPGVYLIEVRQESNVAVEKLIIQ